MLRKPHSYRLVSLYSDVMCSTNRSRKETPLAARCHNEEHKQGKGQYNALLVFIITAHHEGCSASLALVPIRQCILHSPHGILPKRGTHMPSRRQ